MNNAFYKLLKFEFKQNFITWSILLASYITIMIWMTHEKFTELNSAIIGGSIIPFMISFSFLMTLHSYSESISRQSMEMYHLIPVNRNLKFFSKQLITLLIFPVVLVVLYIFFALVIYPLVFSESDRILLSPFFETDKSGILFIWAHSFATFFAIVFKKRKLLYVFGTQAAILIGLLIIAIIYKEILAISLKGDFRVGFTGEQIKNLPIAVGLIIPLVLYVISYRLFFRRQL